MSGGGPIRLLVVTHSLSWGGAERFASTLLGGLDRARFAPAACIVSERATTYELPDDVPVHRLGYRRPIDLPRTVWRLRRLLLDGGVDLVLSNVLKTSALTGFALQRRPRPRWVARAGLAPGRGDGMWVQAAARAVYPRAAALVANSEGMAAALAGEQPELAGRVRHLPNPTDFERLDRLAAGEPAGPAAEWLAAAGDAPLLVALGRLDRQKRPDLALAVLARVRRRFPGARLLWCGDGPLRPAVQRTAAEAGLADAAHFPGFVADPFPFLCRADLFLLTSDFEGLPNALIEAQGLGVPAVATRCPFGPDEIVDHGTTGLLAPPGDAGALAAAALGLLADPGRRRAMGAAAARRARERFAAERVLPRWQELLEETAD